MWQRTRFTVVAAVMAAVVVVLAALQEKSASNAGEQPKEPAKWAPAVQPKPLSENVDRGIAWLAENQLPNGAWGQGEESANMGGGAKLKDVPSMGDTCTAALALVRAGHTPAKGKYSGAVLKAVQYVCGEIEDSDKDSLFITKTRETRLQQKLGTYIDTFTASVLLSEVQGQMPDDKENKRAAAALEKILAKMQKNQRQDGTWDDRGWAATLSQGMAVKGLNRAAQSGAKVDESALAKAETQARKSYDKTSGKFDAKGSAGVTLYSAGASVGGQADSVNTNRQREAEVRQELAKAKTTDEKKQAEATLERFARAEKDLVVAQDALIAKLDDKQFIAGFGSNGGEEFLSYMNIGESLVVKGDDAWKAWDKSITENLNRIQNKDGSWTGHHCVTGRTFCTAAALLVLMVDRCPVPLAAKMKKR